MNLTGNTILIIGGTSGIGLALAEALHLRGNDVVIAGRRQDRLDRIAESHPGITGFRLDLEDPMSVSSLVATVSDRFPALNVLVNNAGISRPESLMDGVKGLAVAEAIIRTNILGVLRITAEFLPLLASQPSSTIITTTSGLAFVPRAPYPTYCATKAFLHSWLQSLRVQLRGTPVDVLELAPPYVQTELAGAAQASDPNAMPLSAYIDEVMAILASDEGTKDEILVERVRLLRNAERDGRYERVFAQLNG